MTRRTLDEIYKDYLAISPIYDRVKKLIGRCSPAEGSAAASSAAALSADKINKSVTRFFARLALIFQINSLVAAHYVESELPSYLFYLAAGNKEQAIKDFTKYFSQIKAIPPQKKALLLFYMQALLTGDLIIAEAVSKKITELMRGKDEALSPLASPMRGELLRFAAASGNFAVFESARIQLKKFEEEHRGQLVVQTADTKLSPLHYAMLSGNVHLCDMMISEVDSETALDNYPEFARENLSGTLASRPKLVTNKDGVGIHGKLPLSMVATEVGLTGLADFFAFGVNKGKWPGLSFAGTSPKGKLFYHFLIRYQQLFSSETTKKQRVLARLRHCLEFQRLGYWISNSLGAPERQIQQNLFEATKNSDDLFNLIAEKELPWLVEVYATEKHEYSRLYEILTDHYKQLMRSAEIDAAKAEYFVELTDKLFKKEDSLSYQLLQLKQKFVKGLLICAGDIEDADACNALRDVFAQMLGNLTSVSELRTERSMLFSDPVSRNTSELIKNLMKTHTQGPQQLAVGYLKAFAEFAGKLPEGKVYSEEAQLVLDFISKTNMGELAQRVFDREYNGDSNDYDDTSPAEDGDELGRDTSVFSL